MTFNTKTLISVLLFLLSSQAHAESIHGKVIGISDGDTLTVMVDRETVKVRIAGIDAPEKSQPFGKKAKAGLSNLVFGQEVRVEKEKLDKYGRTIGNVFVDDTVNVGANLVTNGYAWVYRKYARDRSLYDAEKSAKSKKLGIWSLPKNQQIPPWEWRKQKRTISHSATETNNKTCGSKRYCSQMTSCSEARYYLNKCGLDRLDSDNDGVPCESLCS